MKFDLSETNPEKMDGFDRPAEGAYHFEVNAIEEDDPKSGCMYVDCEVLAGTTKNQEGKVHREYFSKTPKAFSRIAQFAVAVGLTTQDELKAAKESGQSPNIDMYLAVGRQFCGQLVGEEYEGKTRNKLNFNIWSTQSDKAKGIPLNKGKLAEIESGQPTASPAAAGSGDDDNPFGDAF